MVLEAIALGKRGNWVAPNQDFYLPLTEYTYLYVISVRNTLIYLLKVISIVTNELKYVILFVT